MEQTKIEIAQVEAAVNEAEDAQFRELNDLQLAFVGGGNGETVAM